MKVTVSDGLVTLGVRACEHPGRPGKVAALTVEYTHSPDRAFFALTREEAEAIRDAFIDLVGLP